MAGAFMLLQHESAYIKEPLALFLNLSHLLYFKFYLHKSYKKELYFNNSKDLLCKMCENTSKTVFFSDLSLQY